MASDLVTPEAQSLFRAASQALGGAITLGRALRMDTPEEREEFVAVAERELRTALVHIEKARRGEPPEEVDIGVDDEAEPAR